MLQHGQRMEIPEIMCKFSGDSTSIPPFERMSLSPPLLRHPPLSRSNWEALRYRIKCDRLTDTEFSGTPT
jgi:hypothetical protein